MGIKNMTLSEIEAHMHSGSSELTQEEMLLIITHILDVIDSHDLHKTKGQKVQEVKNG